jgi:hypothetical protein
MGGAVSLLEQGGAALAQAKYQDDMNNYQREMALHGSARLSPDEVSTLIRKKDDVVADHMICFLFGREPLLITPAPFFRPLPAPTAQNFHPDGTPKATPAQRRRAFAVFGSICILGGIALVAMAGDQPPQDQGAFSGIGMMFIALGSWLFWRRHKIK